MEIFAPFLQKTSVNPKATLIMLFMTTVREMHHHVEQGKKKGDYEDFTSSSAADCIRVLSYLGTKLEELPKWPYDPLCCDMINLADYIRDGAPLFDL